MNKSILILVCIGVLVSGCTEGLQTEGSQNEANMFSATNELLSVNNFDGCVEAGFPIRETYPNECITPDGQVFLEELEKIEDYPQLIPCNFTPEYASEKIKRFMDENQKYFPIRYYRNYPINKTNKLYYTEEFWGTYSDVRISLCTGYINELRIILNMETFPYDNLQTKTGGVKFLLMNKEYFGLDELNETLIDESTLPPSKFYKKPPSQFYRGLPVFDTGARNWGTLKDARQAMKYYTFEITWYPNIRVPIEPIVTEKNIREILVDYELHGGGTLQDRIYKVKGDERIDLELVVFPDLRDRTLEMHLGWKTVLYESNGWSYDIIVDALTGEILYSIPNWAVMGGG